MSSRLGGAARRVRSLGECDVFFGGHANMREPLLELLLAFACVNTRTTVVGELDSSAFGVAQ